MFISMLPRAKPACAAKPRSWTELTPALRRRARLPASSTRHQRHNPSLAPTRRFTTNSPLLLVPPSSQALLRPQLPFLHSPSSLRQPLLLQQQQQQQQQLARRPISTDHRSYYQKIYEGLKVAVTCYCVVLLYHIGKTGWHQETIEQIYPTPREWSLWSRWRLRTARSLQEPGRFGQLAVDWVKVNTLYAELLARLEDDAIDGGGITVVAEGEDGQKVYDVRARSAEWKEGYFQALMGAGAAAEKMDGWVRDTETNDVGPAEYVRGPSNPSTSASPKPNRRASAALRHMSTGEVPVLREEHCVPAFKSPGAYYTAVLHTDGFRDSQRLDAALAYADWLEYTGSSDDAARMYGTAMDIATAALGADTAKVVDATTGTLRPGAEAAVNENVLRASTAMAIHRVRQGDVANALSAFLSILRTRQALPESMPRDLLSGGAHGGPGAADEEETLFSKALARLKEAAYPMPTTTGAEPATRSVLTACEEAGLMVYIGEILFAASAASSSQLDGLAWTRDAVDLAESSLLALSDEHDEDVMRALQRPSGSMNRASPPDRCRDCLRAGLDNWARMVRRLVRRAEEAEYAAIREVRAAGLADR
ncbi:hypothetical protein KEM52_005917, partial [Ascosphaera acerosa]